MPLTPHFGMAGQVATTLISLVITYMKTALAGNLTHPSGARTECVHYKGA